MLPSNNESFSRPVFDRLSNSALLSKAKDLTSTAQLIGQLQFQVRFLTKQLDRCHSHDFPGRIITKETKAMEALQEGLKADLDFLKAIKQERFGQKRGRKSKYRKAKRSGNIL